MKRLHFLVFLSIIFLSCGTLDRGTLQFVDEHSGNAVIENSKSGTSPTTIIIAEESYSAKKIRQKLDEAYVDWKGIPYILGGSDYTGVDCSAFMQIIFEDYFGIRLPRVTQDQLSVGTSVKRGGIQIGDLIFFRTGRKTLHVGVAVSRSEFLHASTTNGVMISSLEDRYWSDFYLTTRRVL